MNRTLLHYYQNEPSKIVILLLVNEEKKIFQIYRIKSHPFVRKLKVIFLHRQNLFRSI